MAFEGFLNCNADSDRLAGREAGDGGKRQVRSSGEVACGVYQRHTGWHPKKHNFQWAADRGAADIADAHRPVEGLAHAAVGQTGGCSGNLAWRHGGRQLDAIYAGYRYATGATSRINRVNAGSLMNTARGPIKGRIASPREEISAVRWAATGGVAARTALARLARYSDKSCLEGYEVPASRQVAAVGRGIDKGKGCAVIAFCIRKDRTKTPNIACPAARGRSCPPTW